MIRARHSATSRCDPRVAVIAEVVIHDHAITISHQRSPSGQAASLKSAARLSIDAPAGSKVAKNFYDRSAVNHVIAKPSPV